MYMYERQSGHAQLVYRRSYIDEYQTKVTQSTTPFQKLLDVLLVQKSFDILTFINLLVGVSTWFKIEYPHSYHDIFDFICNVYC